MHINGWDDSREMESMRVKVNDRNIKDIYNIKDKAFFGLISNL